MIEIKKFARFYFDANIFIYLIEKNADFHSPLVNFLTLINNNEGQIVTSELAIAECLFRPFKDKNRDLILRYDSFFSDEESIEIYPLTGRVAIDASRIAGEFGLKLLDAIHYYSAIESACTYFVTNDRKFKSSGSVEVIQFAPHQ